MGFSIDDDTDKSEGPLQDPDLDARTIFALHRAAIIDIMDRYRIRQLIAFGSRARGDATPTSDLDPAMDTEPGGDPIALLAAEADLEERLRVNVRIVELPNPRLAEAIEGEGVAFER